MIIDKNLEQEIINAYSNDNLMNVFHLLQDKFGYLSKDNLLSLSKIINVPLAKLQSAASFYSFFKFTTAAKNHIQICECLACEFNNADNITKTIEEVTTLKVGESNEKFSIEKVQCIGCCNKAPAMLFNGKLIDELTTAKVKEILNQC